MKELKDAINASIKNYETCLKLCKKGQDWEMCANFTIRRNELLRVLQLIDEIENCPINGF